MAEFSEFAEFERQGWRDAATAASYASRFARAAAQVAPELVRAVDAGPGTKALDLCCGHGVVARALADAGAQVTGVDFSPAMLEIARAAVPEAVFQEGDAMAPDFGDGVFDAVTIGFGIPHVPDPAVVLAQVARVLVPGGRVAFSVWHGPEVPGILSVMACAMATHGDAEAVLPPGPGAHDFAVPERAFPVLEAAGFIEPEFHTVSSFWLVDDPAAPLEYCRDGAVRYGVMLKKQSPHALSLIAEDVRAYVRGLGDAAPWQVPIPAAVVTARKPG